MKLVLYGTTVLPCIGTLDDIKHIDSIYGCISMNGMMFILYLTQTSNTNKHNIFCMEKQNIYITSKNVNSRELLLIIINTNIYIIFSSIYTFDFIKDKIMIQVGNKYMTLL